MILIDTGRVCQVMFLLPLLSLLFLNQRLVAALRRTNQRRARILNKASHVGGEGSQSASRSEDDITLMLVVVVMVFVVTQAPALVTQVFFFYFFFLFSFFFYFFFLFSTLAATRQVHGIQSLSLYPGAHARHRGLLLLLLHYSCSMVDRWQHP